MARLGIRVLGGFEVRSPAGDRLALPTRKVEALLAYLAMTPGRAHTRDKLTRSGEPSRVTPTARS
jgi:DNA-binding SARP family transcriptional activator